MHWVEIHSNKHSEALLPKEPTGSTTTLKKTGSLFRALGIMALRGLRGKGLQRPSTERDFVMSGWRSASNPGKIDLGFIGNGLDILESHERRLLRRHGALSISLPFNRVLLCIPGWTQTCDPLAHMLGIRNLTWMDHIFLSKERTGCGEQSQTLRRGWSAQQFKARGNIETRVLRAKFRQGRLGLHMCYVQTCTVCVSVPHLYIHVRKLKTLLYLLSIM